MNRAVPRKANSMNGSTIVRRTLFASWLLLCAGGCENQAPPAPPALPPPATDLHSWLGRWNGPEGTFLELARDGERLRITLQDLDGPKTYAGTVAADHVEFERDGKVERIRATSGQDTGMKWLLEKSDCLTIRSGEGFCRD